MKPMNKRTLTLTAATAMGVIIVAMVIALFLEGKISETTFWIVWIVLGLASAPVIYLIVHGITSGIKSPREQAAELADDIDTDNLTLPRTPETTVIEVTTAVIVIAAAVAAIATDFAGLNVRSLYGLTILSTWLLINAYTPRPSFLWGEMHNLKQVYISARLMHILAIMIAFVGLLRACVWLYTPMMGYICSGLTLLTYIVGRIIQVKAWK